MRNLAYCAENRHHEHLRLSISHLFGILRSTIHYQDSSEPVSRHSKIRDEIIAYTVDALRLMALNEENFGLIISNNNNIMDTCDGLLRQYRCNSKIATAAKNFKTLIMLRGLQD